MSRPSQAPRPRRPALAIGALGLVLLAILSVAAIRPPAVRGADAPPNEFSAERALKHLRTLAREPRPPGSVAHDRARDYLVRALAELGLEVEIQRASVTARLAGNVVGADVENVVARVPGAARDAGAIGAPAANARRSAVLLAAHYDSVPHSPGASDDGAAVAALLETARALRSSPPLRNDVLVLFTDAEELGLLGALAFAEQHRWRHDVGVALNFEARGSSGAVAMYATSPGNAALVRALAEAAPAPVANSLVGLLAQALPNDTDATIFIRFGYPTYAFAYAEGVADYHRHTDSLASLDPRSVQHDGAYALGLARHLGALDLDRLSSPTELAYFDLFGRLLVRYPYFAARALAVLELVLLTALLLVGIRRKRLSLAGIGMGMALALVGLLVLPLGVTLTAFGLGKLGGPGQLIERASLYAWHFLPLSGALLVLLWHRALRKRGMVECGMGALAAVALAASALGLLVPAASCALAWSVLFALLGATVWLLAPAARAARVDLALSLGLGPAAVLGASTVYTVFVLQGAFTPGVVAAFCAVFAPLGVPLLGRLGAAERRGLGGALLATALGGAVVASLAGAAIRPRTDSLVYAFDAESRRARWLSADAASDEFVARRVPPSARAEPIAAFSPFIESRRAAPAEVFPLEGARAEPGVGPAGAEHAGTVTLGVRSPAGASCLWLWDDEGSAVRGATVDGRPVTDLSRFSPELDERLMSLTTGSRARSGWRLHYCGLRGRLLGLELELRPNAKARLRAVVQSDGLPDPSLGPRPSELHPALDSDVTLVSTLLVP